jgi:uncharacterized membrane protein
MSTVVVIILIVLVIGGGVYWGRNTILKDTMHKEHDDEELDKLHHLKK